MIIDREILKQIPCYGEWLPEENSKEMFRPAVQWLTNEHDELIESYMMAEKMDGSGECGKFIWASYDDELADLKMKCEAIFNIDLETLENWLHDSAQINDEFVKEPYYHSDKVNEYVMVREINEAEKEIRS